MAEVLAAETFTLSEIAGWSLTQVDCWTESKSHIEDGLMHASGLAMPQTVGETARRGGLRAVRIAPARLWLVQDAHCEGPDFQGLADAAVISLSHGRRRFRLSGRAARDVLACCVALDWDVPNLAPGRAAQTALHKVPVLMIRDAADVFELFVPRSFGQAVWEQIEDAAHRVR
jgi:heterotetrameric sarcosine oxidase gamma subunit